MVLKEIKFGSSGLRVLSWKFLAAVSLLIGTFALFFSAKAPGMWGPETPIYDVLFAMGEDKPLHYMEDISSVQVLQGEELVLKGRTIAPDGSKSSYISKYFTCTHCHNTVKEDPLPTSRNPELRLEYAVEHDLPFLQGTTFHGIVNRESWYNGDYVKKYGIAAQRANKNLREAIQLCAMECSQGRMLEKWEEDAILAYFWSLEFRLKDLDMTAQGLQVLQQSRASQIDQVALKKFLKKQYLAYSPATFSDAPADKAEGYAVQGNAERGKDLYRLSCMHCHAEGGPSEYKLDYATATFRQLANRIPKDSHFSLYQIVRYGTFATPGHRPYMPRYPLERMSHKQVEDLRAYIELMAL